MSEAFSRFVYLLGAWAFSIGGTAGFAALLRLIESGDFPLQNYRRV